VPKFSINFLFSRVTVTAWHCKIHIVLGIKLLANVVHMVRQDGQTKHISTRKCQRVNILHVHREKHRTKILMSSLKVIETILTCEWVSKLYIMHNMHNLSVVKLKSFTMYVGICCQTCNSSASFKRSMLHTVNYVMKNKPVAFI
jgi:hypothetical protein